MHATVTTYTTYIVQHKVQQQRPQRLPDLSGRCQAMISRPEAGGAAEPPDGQSRKERNKKEVHNTHSLIVPMSKPITLQKCKKGDASASTSFSPLNSCYQPTTLGNSERLASKAMRVVILSLHRLTYLPVHDQAVRRPGNLQSIGIGTHSSHLHYLHYLRYLHYIPTSIPSISSMRLRLPIQALACPKGESHIVTDVSTRKGERQGSSR
ncbi:hypothetical protein GGS24DRAFT_427355 [Hypoxylon argillaceum]|nr:hypothetical protein GGS24DRAFT_427355 [Hypoxylon argillaceum]